jgi:protein SCO1/2
VKALFIITWMTCLALPAMAGNSPFFKGEVQAPAAEHGLPKVVQNVGIDQHLGDQVTMSLPVRDEHGNATTLGNYFGKRPVILVMAYYECPNLCTLVMNGVFSAMKTLPFVPGQDFDVVSVSINPHETSALAEKKKDSYVGGYHEGAHADGYHFLVADQPTIDMLTKQVGFRYAYDSVNHQFAHASGIMLLTKDGRLSRYFYGIEYAPRDLKYGLIDASEGKIGSVADKLLLFCYHYDPASGKYGAAITTMLRIGGGLTLLGMGMMFIVFRRRAKLKLHLQTGGLAG